MAVNKPSLETVSGVLMCVGLCGLGLTLLLGLYSGDERLVYIVIMNEVFMLVGVIVKSLWGVLHD